MGEFDEAGFLENGEDSPSGLLDDYDLARYQRNIDFFSGFSKLDENKYYSQSKLKRARICLLGLEGLGSHILYDESDVGGLETKMAVYYTVIPGETGCVECWLAQAKKNDKMYAGHCL